MYFVLKFYLHYSALQVSDTIASIIRSFSAAHAVSACAAEKLLMMDAMVSETCRAE
jgi:hypothetical protein